MVWSVQDTLVKMTLVASCFLRWLPKKCLYRSLPLAVWRMGVVLQQPCLWVHVAPTVRILRLFNAYAVGTRFMATQESDIHENIKQHIVNSSERDTAHILRTFRNTSRVYKNSVAQEVLAKEAKRAEISEILPLVSGARGKTVYENGNPDAGIWTMGQTAGLINDLVRTIFILTHSSYHSRPVENSLHALSAMPSK